MGSRASCGHRRVWRWGALALLLAAPSGWAATCSVTGGQIPFGAYNGLQDLSNTVTTQLKIHCQSPTTTESLLGVTLKVTLSAGTSGNALDRALSLGTDRLRYNVYVQPGITQILGDGTNGTQAPSSCFFAALCGSQTDWTLPLYGAIPPRQDVAPGPYADSLMLVLTF